MDYLTRYLENRTCCMEIGKSLSAYKILQRGVPQESILNPILFCVYIVGLSHWLGKHGVDFRILADDAVLSDAE